MKRHRSSLVVGQICGRLTLLEWLLPLPGTHAGRWRCLCCCGNEVIRLTGSIKSGCTQSCGCLKTDITAARFRTHGLSHLPEYKVWSAMIERCRNTNNLAYKNYGGRGITVCHEWLTSFAAFFRDMGPRPTAKHTIERVDNNGQYCAANCCWATWAVQALNKRPRPHKQPT